MSVTINDFDMAVACAFELAAVNAADESSVHLREQANAYCQHVRALPDGWLWHLQLFTHTSKEQSKFFALQYLQDLLFQFPSTDGSGSLGESDRAKLRGVLLDWLRSGDLASEKTHVKTKIALVLALLAKHDYPEKWSTAFADILSLVNLGPGHVDVFLRFCQMVDQEIVAFNVQRNPVEIEHNSIIKETMRSTGVTATLLTAFHNIAIRAAQSGSTAVATHALEMLAEYIGWADVATTLSVGVLPDLCQLMRSAVAGASEEVESTAVAAASCVHVLVSKSMEAPKKAALLQHMRLIELLQSISLGSGEAAEFATQVAAIVNVAGMEMLAALDQSEDPSLAAAAAEASAGSRDACVGVPLLSPDQLLPAIGATLAALMPLLLTCISHDASEVTEAVMGPDSFLASLLTTLKRQEQGPQQGKHNKRPGAVTAPPPAGKAALPLAGPTSVFRAANQVAGLLWVLFQQTKYPDDFTFDPTDEEEAEVEQFRTELRKVIVNITRVCPELTLTFVGEAIGALLAPGPQHLPQLPFYDVEAVLSLVYHFAEGCTASPDVLSSAQFLQLLRSLLEADASRHPHHAVCAAHYDVAVRYAKRLRAWSELLPPLFTALLSEKGLTSHHAGLRSRSAYLLLRLVKTLSNAAAPFSDALLQGLEGVLLAPVLSEVSLAVSHPSSQSGAASALLSFEDRLYLFEVAGQLIAGESEPNKQNQFLNAVLSPLVSRMSAAAGDASYIHHDPSRAALELSRLLAACTQCSKAFNSKNLSVNAQQAFCAVADTAVSVAQVLPGEQLVRAKLTVFLHRMVLVLGEQLLPRLTGALAPLLQGATELSDCVALLMLLNQLAIKYQGAFLPVAEQLLMPVIRKTFEVVPTTGVSVESVSAVGGITYEEGQRKEMRRAYYSFLQHLVTHQLSAALCCSTNGNAAQLGPLLETVVQGATDPSDSGTQKICFNVLRVLAGQWLPLPTATVSEPVAAVQVPPEARECLLHFLYTRGLPAAFSAPANPAFNIQDALSAAMLNEVAGLLQVLLRHSAHQLAQYVAEVCLPSMACPAAVACRFGAELLGCTAAASPPPADAATALVDPMLKDIFKRFVTEMRALNDSSSSSSSGGGGGGGGAGHQ